MMRTIMTIPMLTRRGAYTSSDWILPSSRKAMLSETRSFIFRLMLYVPFEIRSL